ncbi:MAG: caspase family protein [Ignavibacteriaceae bacterium]
MKFVITIPVSLLICFTTYAQLTGTTQVGRLIPSKNPPVIILIQPNVHNGDTLTVNSNLITINGSVSAENNGVNLFINNTAEPLTKENQFSKTIDLIKGSNTIQFSAVDNYQNSSDLKFTILYAPPIIKPQITLFEPQIKEGNELPVEEKMLTIRGMVKTDIGIQEILVNNKYASLLNNDEFYINYELAYGANNITIKAIDKQGNSSDKNIIVNWTPNLAGPVIKIIDPPVSRGIKIISKTDVVLLKGQAIDESGILEVSVNNREAALQPNGNFNISLFLQAGDNPLIVKATDKKYNVTIDTFVVTRNLESLITAGRYIALVIGINAYDGYWPSLSNAVNDAREVANVLKNDYMFDSVITLIDQQATRNNIIHELELLTTTMKSDDNLLIYYSGHGQFKKELNKGFWVPVDAKTNSIADFISNSDVKTFLSGIPAKHTLLISDACFAGDIFRGKSTESIPFDPNNMERYYKEVFSKTSRIAITSGGLEEVEDAGKEGHSIFTYYLLKSLKENKSKYWDASQLFNDFRIAVTNNSEQTPLLQVVRETGDEGGQFIFVKRN